MQKISIEQKTFERLQDHAKPLVDTTDMVINRALDALEFQESGGREDESDTVITQLVDPQDLPNLTHTKILSASVSGQCVVKPSWSKLFDSLLVTALKRTNNFIELRKLCLINMIQGRKVDAGYHHLAEIDISVQGMSANVVCRAIVAVAQYHNIGLNITFMWRCKDGALYPGEKRKLCLPN